ncbi:unnamed protein product [Musa acuminata var. zebrina]
MDPVSDHHHEAWSWEPPVNHHQHYRHHPYRGEQIEPRRQREHMFEKSLTPSDVGKLNRLVIPKQQAEKYFPLAGDSGEKDLLLNFEDEAGKPWMFRYSYWSSSQSYVLTKGWSRFVKEKKLDAGDVVLFERLRAGGDRLYIGCRRQGREESPPAPGAPPARPSRNHSSLGTFLRPGNRANSLQFSTSRSCSGDREEEAAKNTAEAPANSKRLRLFGVNLN